MRIVLLISGSGTTAVSVIKAVFDRKLKNVEIAGVISSNSLAKGVEKIKKLGIQVKIVDPKVFSSNEEFGDKLLRTFRGWKVDFISQNGWLPMTPKNVVAAYKHKMINQHPGPLDPGSPDFGGKSMFGARVTCARVAYCWLTHKKNPWTEATTHWVNEDYDKGDLVRTERLQLSRGDSNVTVQSLTKNPAKLIYTTIETQKKLLPLEHKNVIESIKLISSGKTYPLLRKKRLVAAKNFQTLQLVKLLAKQLFPNG